ncbi:HAD family hydrolase [Streptomyces sp. NPDC007808]|uniref:HAD family hydrolase n=1 Tax=Streptomyces sp. NPDC007808 TaxID=3364779 RepID=UPI0036A38BFB
MPVLFFDIGATLADARAEADGTLTLLPRPRVLAVLDSFRDMPKGIISNPGTDDGAAERAAVALHSAFPGRFTDARLVHWGPKNNRSLFDEAIAAATEVGREGAGAAGADDCVFVGEDSQERAFAREAGMRTAAHPVFAPAAVENRPVLWARIELPEGRGLPDLAVIADETEVVPLHVPSERLVLAMLSARGAEVLEQAGFAVDLRGPVAETAAFLVRDDRAFPSAAAPTSATAAGRTAT